MRTNRGAKLSGIKSKLHQTAVEDYSHIIVHAGGNDASSRREIDAVEHDAVEIIKNIKDRSPTTKVYFSEVLPRRDVDVSYVNNTLRYVCDEYGGLFISNKSVFKKVDNVHYWKDGIHLSDKGTSALLKQMNNEVPILRGKGAQRDNRNSSFSQSVACYFCGEHGIPHPTAGTAEN